MPSLNHSKGNSFFNPWPNAKLRGFSSGLRWSLERLVQKRRKGTPPQAISPISNLRTPSERPRVTWVGHSTFLIQMAGLNFLTDPIWSQRASPFQFIGPRRISQPGIRLKDLPEIHAVLISHDHYDHLDSSTVEQLRNSHPKARWFVPLRLAKWLSKHGVHDAAEHDWGASSSLGVVQLTCTPAQHFSGRSVTGRDRTLWCGWIVRAPDFAVMFAGDTGLHPDFEQIARLYGPVSIAILPIGAYDPRWFMRPVHMDPEDAVAAYTSVVNANADHRCVFIPSHWGTFLLTDEPVDEPPVRLQKAWADAGLRLEDLVVLRPGETHTYRS